MGITESGSDSLQATVYTVGGGAIKLTLNTLARPQAIGSPGSDFPEGRGTFFFRDWSGTYLNCPVLDN